MSWISESCQTDKLLEQLCQFDELKEFLNSKASSDYFMNLYKEDREKFYYNILSFAIQIKVPNELIKKILDEVQNVNMILRYLGKFETIFPPLVECLVRENYEIAEYLIEKKNADVNLLFDCFLPVPELVFACGIIFVHPKMNILMSLFLYHRYYEKFNNRYLDDKYNTIDNAAKLCIRKNYEKQVQFLLDHGINIDILEFNYYSVELLGQTQQFSIKLFTYLVLMDGYKEIKLMIEHIDKLNAAKGAPSLMNDKSFLLPLYSSLINYDILKNSPVILKAEIFGMYRISNRDLKALSNQQLTEINEYLLNKKKVQDNLMNIFYNHNESQIECYIERHNLIKYLLEKEIKLNGKLINEEHIINNLSRNDYLNNEDFVNYLNTIIETKIKMNE
ncbi:hypothetical protein BCR36DRAFT_24974 [Piromyces finnis]|uniref:Ankyrin n=1 Tax=Piromyces finnis TaxID=1754191 RepID=A0A1Y1VED1_9FUNG|nr:hypothetical protein BCR36DRAFT_24974 [Piromyces finnis]|eukprot:ORX53357.1 hypothetical protein BCR36DRAFT_24974 [Piromyces finnis]